MRFRSRVDDSTFELNLAPMLDIIVSIVPMLLMSVAFVHVTIIETPVPQVVERAIASANEKTKDQTQVSLSMSKEDGFKITVVNKGATKQTMIALKNGEFDMDGLHAETLQLKKAFPEVFRLELNPNENVPLNEIVGVMDTVRMVRSGEPKIVFNDVDNGKPVETNLMFPDIVFGNVTGG